MYKSNQNPAILLLQDGTVYYGKGAGFTGIATGEICFNTGMTGYQEIFTDPSYHKQIMVMPNVHIGNYGTKISESESSKIQISGLVCRNLSSHFSRGLTSDSLQDFLALYKIVSIYDVDTRAIVRHIRTHGAMNAIISNQELDLNKLKANLSEVPLMAGLELASNVSVNHEYEIGNPESKFKLAVLDFGIKQHMLQEFKNLSFRIKVFPAKTNFETIEKWNPDAYFLSNGPGDPESMLYAVETVKKMIQQKKPIFGICLGHQILGIALGIKTVKMFHGHRGINHPVKNLETGLCEITSQNHGFALDYDSVTNNQDVVMTHINLNDASVEGIKHKSLPIFSVQYHPEATPGPHDSKYLFQKFSSLILDHKTISLPI